MAASSALAATSNSMPGFPRPRPGPLRGVDAVRVGGSGALRERPGRGSRVLLFRRTGLRGAGVPGRAGHPAAAARPSAAQLGGRRRRDVPLLASVCTGALVYAAAGLLNGRPATTHWRSLDLLAELDPSIDVRADERFVDDGYLITSAGISAGIDMALHLVPRLAGVQRAWEVRRGIQYDPAPPVGTAPRRPAGGSCSAARTHLGGRCGPVAAVLGPAITVPPWECGTMREWKQSHTMRILSGG